LENLNKLYGLLVFGQVFSKQFKTDFFEKALLNAPSLQALNVANRPDRELCNVWQIILILIHFLLTHLGILPDGSVLL